MDHSNLPSRINALRQQVLLAPETWQPETGESLIGEYIGHKQVEHPKYGAQWQVLLRNEIGTVYAVWANPWIRQTLKAQSIMIGDLVAIAYLGKRTTGAGVKYNAYSLIVDKG